MAQAKIYWDMENYGQVEKVCQFLPARWKGRGRHAFVFTALILQIFRKSVEFCNEHDVWRLNVAHVLFMQVSCYVHDMYKAHCVCTKTCNAHALSHMLTSITSLTIGGQIQGSYWLL